MSFFLIIAAPVWYFLFVSFYPTPSRGWRGVLLPFLGGLVTGFAALAITLSMLSRTPFEMAFGRLYLWAWLRGPGFPLLLTALVVSLRYIFVPTSYSRMRQIAGWFAGAAFSYLIWGAVQQDAGFDGYRVLLSPFVWMGTAGGAVWLCDRALRPESSLRCVLLAAALLFSSVATFLPVLYGAHHILPAWILTILLFAGSVILVFLDSRGHLST